MFAAAILYSAPTVTVAIYSTCKRISQMLLRNVIKFLNLIFDGLKVPKFKVIRENMEELVVKGPEGGQDVRTVSSYPSKVRVSRASCAARGKGTARSPSRGPPSGPCTRRRT